MTYRITMALLGLCISSAAWAYGEVGRWSSGWGQGVSEYVVVDARHNQLYIACGDDPATMVLTVNGHDYGYGAAQGFALLIDGQEVGQPYETESRVGSDNFRFAWDGIRKARKLAARLPSGQLLPLPLKDAAKTLPARQSNAYPCVTTW